MTRQQKIVGKFKIGYSIAGICRTMKLDYVEVETVLRDYLNGNFKLKGSHENQS